MTSVLREEDSRVDDDIGNHTIRVDAPSPTERPLSNASPSRYLYVSHAFSTWNARTYEFAAIIFTATAYPGTLVASSLRGIVTTVSLILLSSLVGQWIDFSPSRLRPMVLSISVNRASVIAASLVWVILLQDEPVRSNEPSRWASSTSTSRHSFDVRNVLRSTPAVKGLLFTAVILLGILERLSSSANMTSMERDWVPALAGAMSPITPDGQANSISHSLTRLNASMRRIDLICKLVAPIVISAIATAVNSVCVAAISISVINILSWSIEMWCAREVWAASPALQSPRSNIRAPAMVDVANVPTASEQSHSIMSTIHSSVTKWVRDHHRGLRIYFTAENMIYIPSLALCLLHLSVLSYGATFMTYLLSAGLSLNVITIARTLGSVVEVSSTFLTSPGIKVLSPLRSISDDEHDETEHFVHSEEQISEPTSHAGLQRLGLWGVTSQLICLVPVSIVIFQMTYKATDPLSISDTILSRVLEKISSSNSITPAVFSLFLFLSLSRLGLWVFDLAVQQVTQTGTTTDTQSSFAGTETMFISVFELCHWIAAAILYKPQQFTILAFGSVFAVAMSACMYAYWIRTQRGHLVHWEKIRQQCSCVE